MGKNTDIPKFTVAIITYNQEKFIGRALDSVLIQKEWVYEIVICDDCSKDNNWNIIMDYYRKYPEIIRPFRNEKNLGIYGNIERTWQECTGDLIIDLSGDDTLYNGIFEEAYKTILKYKIDYKNKAVSLFCDFDIKYPHGFRRKAPRNNLLLNKNFDPVSLKLRGLIFNSTSFYSNKLLKKYIPVPKDLGHFCDELVDIQRVLFSDEIYYFKFIGSTYYAHIGVSVNHTADEYLKSMDLTSEILKNTLKLGKKDILYLDYQHHKRILLYGKHSWKQFFTTIKYYFKSRELKYGIRGLDLSRISIDTFKLLIKIFKQFLTISNMNNFCLKN